MNQKKDYIIARKQQQALRTHIDQDPYRLQYHIVPPSGWLNDPNGLCEYQGVHHIYYQYSPFTAEWGMKLWGHYTTTDWYHFQECEPFLFPDTKEDRDGVYSGSAFVREDGIHFFYTGNVKYVDRDYDYILEGREQNTIEVVSPDGFQHGKKQCRLTNHEYPADMSKHVRDPNVFEIDGIYYMVLGARDVNDRGCVLLYQSIDGLQWNYHMRITTNQPFGYMWECPDIICVDSQWFLICCPQGVNQKGIDYANIYQCGYFALDINVVHKTYTLHEFYELDRGFDIYAPQSYEDQKGRRILLAWMGLPDADYHNEKTVAYGWQHALTMPRILHATNHRLTQEPMEELKQLRVSETFCVFNKDTMIHVPSPCYELELELYSVSELHMQVAEDVYVTYSQEIVEFSMGESGCGRTKRSVKLTNLTHVQIFVDTSSIELFINHGEEVFTSRWYRNCFDFPIHLQHNGKIEGTYYALKGYQIQRENV